LLIDAIGDFESGYQPYIAAKESYLASYQKLLTIKIAEAFIGYGVATLLLYALVPLIAKNGRTIGNLVFKSGYRSNKGNEPSFWQITLRFLVILLEFAGTAPIALLLVYGKEGVNLLSLMLFGFLPCFTLLIYSIVVCLLSYLLSFFFKKRKQTLSEMASGLIHVDGRKNYEI
ncbi:MAG: RDD family protein, partial [Bacilli bacterium]|nr:RDD family protein [Bacilli bacterium]